MKLKVSLAIIPNTNPPVLHPYWFSPDMSIHLSSASKEASSREIDTKDFNKNVLTLIYNAAKSGLLEVSDIKGLLAEINKDDKDGQIEVKREELNSPEELKETKKNEEIEAILKGNIAEVKKKIGSAKISKDKTLSEGIGSEELLDQLLKAEEEGKNRKDIISCIKSRKNALKKAVKIEVEEHIEIDETNVEPAKETTEESASKDEE